MTQQLQEKIRQHRERKNMKMNFDQSIEDKKNKLRELTNSNANKGQYTPKEEHSNIQARGSNLTKNSGDSFMEFKHRRYIEVTRELMEAKAKLTEMTHRCEDMKTQVFFEEKKISDIRLRVQAQYQEEQDILERKLQKYETEKKEKVLMYQERVAKNLEHVEQLLKEKQEQNDRKLKFIERKKKFEDTRKKIKEKYEEELKGSRDKWADEERIKREQWEKNKMDEIEGRTLRNLEPQIQRIVQRGKDEINKIREKYEGMMDEFRKAADEEFEKSVKSFKAQEAVQLEEERCNIIDENNKKLREQAQHLEVEFEQERIKAKNDYNEEIKNLQHNRRVQSQDHIRKNRYFYVQNLEEIKKIKDDYEVKIREMDGVLMKEVDQKEAWLQQRNRTKIEVFRQSERVKLKKRMEEYDRKVKSAIQLNIEKLSNEIAIENAAYQRRIAKESEHKCRQEKENAEVEIKQIKKSIIAIESKIEAMRREKEKTKLDRNNEETNYLQIKQDNEFLVRKLLEISKEVEELKVNESAVESRKSQRRAEVEDMWDRQISSIRETLANQEQEMKTTIEVMQQKQRQALAETEELIREIEKHSNKIIKQKKVQQQGLLIKIEHEEKQKQSLKVILREQLELMKNYNIQ